MSKPTKNDPRTHAERTCPVYNDEPSLVARIYNGLDERKGWPVVIVKPITPVGRAIPVGEIKPRPPKALKPKQTLPASVLAKLKKKLYKLFGL
jgi:hypothetical protein